jgi:hypothetical protein
VVIAPDQPIVVDFHPFPEPRPDWETFREHLRRAGFTEPGEAGPGVPRTPQILTHREVMAALTSAGVTGPREFLDAEPDTIVAATGMDTEAVRRVRDQLGGLKPFFGSRTF